MNAPASTRKPPLAAIAADLVRLTDYERQAPAHLTDEAWRHLQDGEALTLQANRAAFDGLRWLPRRLADLDGGGTAIDLLGRRHAAPFLLAPVAYQKMAHPDGELATARAAGALGIGMTASTLASAPLEEIAAAYRAGAAELGIAPGPLWFQLYFQHDRAWTLDLVRRAEAAGYEALVVTVDAAAKRAGFTLPAGVDAANLRGMPVAPLEQPSLTGGPILFGTALLAAAPTWRDIESVRDHTRMPLVLKGLLASDDVRTAVDIGAQAVVLSNHGGRVLDGLPSAIEVLPRIADAVGDDIELLVDGGVRSGSDVAKALALGARAAMIGRPQVHSLAVAGSLGVAHMLYLLRAELELCMVQLGCRTTAELRRCLLPA